jgi:hypothetical protein
MNHRSALAMMDFLDALGLPCDVQNHFSLLKINEREGLIYHYDLVGKGENTDIKVCRGYLIRSRVLIS